MGFNTGRYTLVHQYIVSASLAVFIGGKELIKELTWSAL